MKRLYFSLIFVCIFTCPGQSAEIPEVMRQLVGIGLKNNLGLQIEMVEVDLQKEQNIIEDAQFDSTVYGGVEFEKSATPYESSTGFSGNLTSEEVLSQLGVQKRLLTGAELNAVLSSQRTSDNDSSSDLDNRFRTAFVLELKQPLLKGWGSAVNSTDLQISQNLQKQKQLSYLIQVQEYLLNLENRFWQFLYNRQLVTLRQESFMLAQSLMQANRKKFEAGQVAITEIQEAETAVADRELSLSQARQQYDIHKEGLRRLINADLPDNLLTAPFIPSDPQIFDSSLMDFAQMFDAAKQRRLEYRIAAYNIKNSRLQLALRENALNPQLDLSVMAGASGLAGEDRGIVPGSRYDGSFGDSLQGLSEADGYQWQVGLNFSMPIDNRAAKAQVNQARHQLRQKHYAIEDLDGQVRNELAEQAIAVERAQEQLEIARRYSALAKISLRQEERRLQEGLSNTFRMISFQEKMVNAKIGYAQAVTTYYQSLAALSQAQGETFSRYNVVVAGDSEELSLEN